MKAEKQEGVGPTGGPSGGSLGAGDEVQCLGMGGLKAPLAPTTRTAAAGFLPPRVPLLMSLCTWLFMEGKGSPSYSGKSPKSGRALCPPPLLPWEAGPRQGTPTSTQACGGTGRCGECRPNHPSVACPATPCSFPSSLVLEAVLGGQQLPACSYLLLSLLSWCVFVVGW